MIPMIAAAELSEARKLLAHALDTLDEEKKQIVILKYFHDKSSKEIAQITGHSEGGSNLSGGQRQRLEIARALATNPTVLILDEATSALDNIAQAAVCDSLDKMNCTRIVIAHRLSTIRNCDRIIVLNNGKVTEQGTFDRLMEMNGLFRQLADRQMF